MSGTDTGVVRNHGYGCREDPVDSVAGNASHRPNGVPKLSTNTGIMIRREEQVQGGQVDIAIISQRNDLMATPANTYMGAQGASGLQRVQHREPLAESSQTPFERFRHREDQHWSHGIARITPLPRRRGISARSWEQMDRRSQNQEDQRPEDSLLYPSNSPL